MSQAIRKELAQKIDILFSRESIDRNTYLFNTMKPNLELPLKLIFKERKLNAITSDETLILEVLKGCDKVRVNEEKRTLQLRIKSPKNRIVVKKATDNQLEAIEKIITKQFFVNDCKTLFDKESATLTIIFKDEMTTLKVFLFLQSDNQFKNNVTLEESSAYEEIRETVEKNKKLKAQGLPPISSVSTYNTFQPVLPQQPFNMSTFNSVQQQFNQFQQFQMMPLPVDKQSRSPGFTRRAIESDSDEDEFSRKPIEKLKPAEHIRLIKQETYPTQSYNLLTIDDETFPSLDTVEEEIERQTSSLSK